MTNTLLTSKEVKVLDSIKTLIVDSETGHGGNIIEICDYSGLPVESVKGVLGSLTKKGKIYSEYDGHCMDEDTLYYSK